MLEKICGDGCLDRFIGFETDLKHGIFFCLQGVTTTEASSGKMKMLSHLSGEDKTIFPDLAARVGNLYRP